MKKVVWISGSAIVLVGVGTMLLTALNQPSDDELIRQALVEAGTGGRDGTPGGVMEYLSRGLTLNDQAAGSRAEIADFIRKAKPEVTFGEIKPTITGDQARVITPVTLSMSLFGASQTQTFSNVEITLQREMGTTYGVIPTPRWRIASVRSEEIDRAAYGGN